MVAEHEVTCIEIELLSFVGRCPKLLVWQSSSTIIAWSQALNIRMDGVQVTSVSDLSFEKVSDKWLPVTCNAQL